MSGSSVVWLGHSTVVVRLDDACVATDPVLRPRIAHLRREREPEPAALEGVGAVLVSHVHHDHLDLPSLGRFGRDVRILVPAGAGRLVRRRGFRGVDEVAAGDVVDVDGIHVRVTHAEHASARRLGTSRTASVGYVLDGTQTVYFAGDTDLFPAMEGLGPLDAALLPIAGWGPRLPRGHLDPERAAAALLLLRPRVAIPIHWGTFAPWRPPTGEDGAAHAFAAAAAAAAPEVHVAVLRPGERYELG